MCFLIIALCWAWSVFLNMIVIVMEQLYGEYPSKNVTLLMMGYGGYMVIPVVVMARMIQTPVFGKMDVKTD